jgi:acyl carrier protein
MKESIDIEKFYGCFVDALCVDRKDLAMDKSLIVDLGADSIDFLDLIYQLEREFNITIPQGDLQRRVREELSDDCLNENGDVNKKGIIKLANKFSELDFTHHEGDVLRINDIPLLFTVGTFYKIVEVRMQDNV